jgi:hypothetical protein
VASCVTFYSAIFPFTALATDFFHDKWNMPMASAEGLGFFSGVFFNFTHLFTTAKASPPSSSRPPWCSRPSPATSSIAWAAAPP